MAKAEGKGKLCLFNVQGEVEKQLQIIARERLCESLGMAKPEKKSFQRLDIPIIPKEGDFMLFPFRQLSATIVGGGTWKATDFSKDGVLKRGTKLLNGVPAYLNHIQMVGKEIGTIGEAEWSGPYKNSKGDQVPGGIEAPFVIDSVLEPDLCRKMSSPNSPITSCSVTVIFEWEASHEFEREGDFYWHLGEVIKDGDGNDEMVRRIVTKITAFEESSLVWMGADPFAKMLDDSGQVINIDKAAAFAKYKLSEDPERAKYDPERKFYVVDCLDSEKFLHLSKSSAKFIEPKTENVINMNEELLLFLAAGFGVTVDDLKAGKVTKAQAEKFKIVGSEAFAKMKSAEDFQKEVDAKTALETKVTDLNNEIATLKADKTKLEGEKTTLSATATIGTSVLTKAREEAKRVYGIFSKGKPEKTITDEIEAEVDFEKLEKKIEMWGGKAISEFGGSCAKCGSKEIKFRSSVPTGGEKGEDKEEEFNLAESIL